MTDGLCAPQSTAFLSLSLALAESLASLTLRPFGPCSQRPRPSWRCSGSSGSPRPTSSILASAMSTVFSTAFSLRCESSGLTELAELTEFSAAGIPLTGGLPCSVVRVERLPPAPVSVLVVLLHVLVVDLPFLLIHCASFTPRAPAGPCSTPGGLWLRLCPALGRGRGRGLLSGGLWPCPCRL